MSVAVTELVSTIARHLRPDLYDEAAAPVNANPSMQNYYAAIIGKHEAGVAGTLAALETAGWRAVPVDPTEEMVLGYRRSLTVWIEGLPESERAKGGRFGVKVNAWKKLRLRWNAMVAASPKVQA